MKKICIILFLLITFFTSRIYAEDINSRAVVLLDSTSNKILYAKNPHLRLPPASTAKLVSAMVVIDKMNLNSVVTISRKAATTQSVAPRLIPGEKYTVRDLLHLSLMRSVNGAAVALAEAAAGSEDSFVDMMNAKVHALGLQNTRFINSSGLPGNGQYITAYDLSLVMKASLDYHAIKEIINTRTKDIFNVNGRQIFLKNTNHLLWKEDDVIGGKTGYTRAAGHCFVCAVDKDDTTLIVAILGEAVREELWQNTFALFSKGQDILSLKAEPVIYFSDIKRKPIVPASYKQKEGAPAKKKANIKAKNKAKKPEKKGVKSSKKKNVKTQKQVKNKNLTAR
ncbi:MAG: D-alanyl-D-alanine carboxypeptidase [Bacteroidetes bacterium]|nr:D-alanyl-D-alanine carboxypeptidase [Bacteroidota bacterium]